MQRAFKYLLANNELLRIRKRTRQGIRHDQEYGRFVNRAPFGYLNDKDGDGKSILVVNTAQAKIIQKIYADYLSGIPAHIIYKSVQTLGFSVKGNSAITKVLSNCVYAGLIRAVADRKNKERFVKGIHTPDISKGDFWQAQKKMGNKRPSKVQPESRFPLRGLPKCWCGKHMTTSFSKGKKKYYLYYRCINHTGTNLPGEMVHGQFKELLRSMSFTPAQVQTITHQVNSTLRNTLKDKSKLLDSKTRELNFLNDKIENLEERFLEKQIELETYRRWFSKYSAERGQVMDEMKGLRQENKSVWERAERLITALCSLDELYERASLKDKNVLVQKVFKNALSYSDGAFRTAYLNELFTHNSLIAKKKGLLVIEQPSFVLGETPFCSP